MLNVSSLTPAKRIIELKEKILSKQDVTKKEILELVNINEEDLSILYESANSIRKAFIGDSVDLCSIANAKSGGCSEDCKFCAQSSHYSTSIENYPLIDTDTALKQAKEVESEGVHRFSLVTSGKGIGKRDFEKVLTIYDTLNAETSLSLCSSLGIINEEKAIALKEKGITNYHHNLETSRRYYPYICTTHSYDDRISTILEAKKAGLQICSGGIIGLGETIEDRIDMAFDLKSLDVRSVPINILTPIPGTPMENNLLLSNNGILKTIAIFRFILPKAHIRYAGGRIQLGEEQITGFKAGISSILVGNYLTTTGQSIKQDKQMIEEAGLIIR